MPPDDRPQRVTLPTLQILAAFMSDLKRDDWYGRALSVRTGLGSGTVLQCLYRLDNWGWLESWWEDRDVATRDGRPPRWQPEPERQVQGEVLIPRPAAYARICSQSDLA